MSSLVLVIIGAYLWETMHRFASPFINKLKMKYINRKLKKQRKDTLKRFEKHKKKTIDNCSYHPDVESQLSETCPICLDTIEEELEITKCLHTFHKSCLDEWESDICPCCRRENFRLINKVV